MRGLPHLILKEFRQMRRSRPMMAVTFGMPIIQLLVLGFAVSTDVEHVPTAVIDLDRTAASRSLVSRFENTRYLDIVEYSGDIRDGERLLRRGEAIISVTIPRDFRHDLVRGAHPVISLSADAQNTNVALTGAAYVRGIIASWGGSRTNIGAGIGGIPRPVGLESRIWYNPELKSMLFMVPGILVVLVTIIAILLTALAIVREREIGTLEQLMVTPLTRTELILGKTVPFAIVALIDLVIGLGVARMVYGIPFAGSVPLFLGLSVLYIFCTLGIGIFISTVTTTQQQALFTAWFVLVFCLLMSGFLTPIANMPTWLHQLTYLNPMRYYVTIVRELLLKGAGWSELWGQALALAGIAVVIMTGAVSRFHKNMG